MRLVSRMFSERVWRFGLVRMRSLRAFVNARLSCWSSLLKVARTSRDTRLMAPCKAVTLCSGDTESG